MMIDGKRVRPTCKDPGCGKPHQAGGYCGRHYEQVRRYGRTYTRAEAKGIGRAKIIEHRRTHCIACNVELTTGNRMMVKPTKQRPYARGRCRKCHNAYSSRYRQSGHLPKQTWIRIQQPQPKERVRQFWATRIAQGTGWTGKPLMEATGYALLARDIEVLRRPENSLWRASG